MIFLLLISAAVVFGQKKPVPRPQKPAPAQQKKVSLVQLIESKDISWTTDAAGQRLGIVHKGVFQQDFSTLRSDSAYWHSDQNTIEAFGHVVITQGDTLHVFSDKLDYNGNTKIAVLTDHVIMIDKDARLTTNNFTYNTATKFGTYVNGGKLVNKDNTLVSKNGYYFANSRDSYFRYDVVCTTPDAIIKTDTLRYNSGTRISYFYGPSHIYSKKEKDRDTLYTENGLYETITEQAKFGKNNLYTSATKSLKGDSLFYDRLKGYGRAVKHVVFNDTEQKVTLFGDLGEYFKADDKAIATRNAYMILVTEQKDSTATDIPAKKQVVTNKAPTGKLDTVALKKLGLSALGNVNTDTAMLKKLGLTAIKRANTDTTTLKRLGLAAITKTKKDTLPVVKLGPPPNTKPRTPASLINKASPPNSTPIKGKTTSAIKTPPPNTAPVKNLSIPPGKVAAVKDAPKTKAVVTSLAKPDHIKRDSIFIGADTLETRVLAYKDFKELRRLRYAASHPDTTKKLVYVGVTEFMPKGMMRGKDFGLLADTMASRPYHFGRPKAKPVPKPKPVDLKKLHADSVRSAFLADSLQKAEDHGLVDTSRIRIISAHHAVKMFKSDLQAKSDSMFFSSSDSTIRMFVKPMIWTQGAQLSGDTINLQMKNRQLDNMDMFPTAFVVYVDKGDSTHYNQLGGKKLHATFKDNKMNTMLVTGNAETIYFNRDSATNKVTQMTRTLSSTLYSYFKNNEVKRGNLKVKSETNTNDIPKVKDEDKLLKAFIWKPKDRPKSRKDVLVPYNPPVTKSAKPVGKSPKGAVPLKPAATDTSKVKGKPDSVKKAPVLNKFGTPIIYN